MTRTPSAASYDDDFFAWTQEQATALRAVPREVAGDVDVAHVAEEIEDLGRRDLREVESLLKRLVEHLIKIGACLGSRDQVHWFSEALQFQDAAVSAYTPGMRRSIDVEKIWDRGQKIAIATLSKQGIEVTARPCPFDLDDLLSTDFDMDHALRVLQRPHRPRRDAVLITAGGKSRDNSCPITTFAQSSSRPAPRIPHDPPAFSGRSRRACRWRSRRPARLEPHGPLSVDGVGGIGARPLGGGRRVQGLRRRLQGPARRPRPRRRAARRGAAIRGDRRHARPHRQLCRPRLCGQHDRSRTREILRRHPGQADQGLDRPPLLPARTQPHRRCGARRRRLGRTVALSPLAGRSAQGQALSARRQDRAAVPRKVGLRRVGLEPPLRRDDHRTSLRHGRREPADRARADAPPG